jgi:hypothetical protein
MTITELAKIEDALPGMTARVISGLDQSMLETLVTRFGPP